MKKLLLTLSLVLGFITLAKATDVTMPESGKKWTDYGEKSPITVQGYKFSYTSGSINATDLRPYSGATLTITAPEGKSFTKVVATGTRATTAVVSGANKSSWAVTATKNGDNTVVTFEASSPQSSLAFKGAKGSTRSDDSQFRIATIVITEDGGGDVPGVVETPKFSEASGEVKAGTEVSISCGTAGATVYYTIDDSTPSASNGTKYSAPIAINEAKTIKAIAVKEGMKDSPVATAAYTIKAETVGETSVSFIFGGKGAMSDFDGATPGDGSANNLSGKSKTINDVTLSFSSATGTNSRWWKRTEGNETRIYTGNSFTVSVPEGNVIKSIEFVHSYTTKFIAKCSSGTLGELNNKQCEWTANGDVNSVTFTANSESGLSIGFMTMTVNVAKVATGAPAAPVLTMPEGYNADTPVNLTEYSNGKVKYFDVTVSWPEGMTLVYTVSARGTMLNRTPLVYPEQPKEESTPAAVRANGPAKVALKNPVTGTISDASSAVFSFASDGEFSCYVEDAAGNQSNAVSMTFQGQSTGVEDIIANGADDGEAVFYNMQGVRVANPAAGNLYIKVQGNKATKVLVK